MGFGAGETPNKEASTFSSSAKNGNSKSKIKEIAQFNADARLLSEFEQSGESFNYSKSVIDVPDSVPEHEIVAYLSRIQRGGLIQPFGCMIAIQEPTFKIISYSENCVDLLGLNGQFQSKQLSNLIGTDARTIFTPSSSASLMKAVSSREISMLNPVWVHSRVTQKPFYAILHRVDVGIVIDLEPSRSADSALSLAGAVQSQKLAVRAISRLQALPGGDIGVLCDTVVEDVQKLTGFDRVMVYKFHDDDHGEVLSEIRRTDLEPYLGLHYPATDIPQAARFLFKQNRVRMICDCHATPVRVIQSEELENPLCLVNSTLRSPHGCHTQYMANMGSIASLAMAVTISSTDTTKLWGLVVCHHTSPRCVPFPLRYACEFLMQAFGLQLYMELQLANQLSEKKILRTQTLLCDMLLRDSPSGIVTQSPSIMDLVKCDGAGLYYRGTCWLVGVTPSETLVKDISQWLLDKHGDSTGLSTDSLADAGYPGADMLGDAVCGMATARITSKDFLFWFRSHTGKEVKWGGAKHHPEDKDDGGRMHPRSSFIAFLEVVKNKSMPWEVSEINAIHSLQLILRDSFQDLDDSSSKTMMMFGQHNDGEMIKGVDELTSVACEMARLIETATAPIFGVDSNGIINGWNEKIAELTGIQATEAMGKSLVPELIHEDSNAVIDRVLCRALQGEEDKDVELKIKTFRQQCSKTSFIYIMANACISRDYTNNIVGVCFVGQDVTSEKVVMDKFIRLQGDYKSIVQSLNPLIPPIFASDENACCSEWNAAMVNLTGWARDEIIGNLLPGEIFGGFVRLKNQDSLTKFMILLYKAISGQDTEKFPFSFFDRKGKFVEVLLTVSKRSDAKGNVVGCFCFLQIEVPEDDRVSEEHGLKEGEYFSRLKEIAYIRQEMRNPLNGIRFTHQLLVNTSISDDQRQFLATSDACFRQMMTFIEDMDLGNIEEGNVRLNVEEFLLGSVLDAIVSQSMIMLKEKDVQLIHDIPEEMKTLYLYGDQIKLQLILSDFFLNIVHHAPFPDGWVEIKISPILKVIPDGNDFIHLQFRMTHPGEGIPSVIIKEMFQEEMRIGSHESLGLNISRKVLHGMNGQVRYVREDDKCYFLIDLQLKAKKANREASETTIT